MECSPQFFEQLIVAMGYGGSISDAGKAVGKSDEKSLILIDGMKLTELMFLYNVGVSNIQIFTIKRMDLDFFEES